MEAYDLRIELARLAYGERIMRCTNQAPSPALEDLLSLDGELNKARLWLALAQAKREGNPDFVRGLLCYLFSQVGRLDPHKRRRLVERIERGELHLKDLTQEQLIGSHLEWKHIFQLVGREFNPTREKARVREIYEQITAKGLKGVTA